MRRRFERGARGEQRAGELLERWGFEIVAAEPRFEGEIEVDGETMAITIRPDYLVQRGHELAVVEVKTGESAADPSKRNTRRQLREYAALAPADALYLLDPEAERLMRVRFPESEGQAEGRRASRGLLFALGLAAGLGLAALWAWLGG